MAADGKIVKMAPYSSVRHECSPPNDGWRPYTPTGPFGTVWECGTCGRRWKALHTRWVRQWRDHFRRHPWIRSERRAYQDARKEADRGK